MCLKKTKTILLFNMYILIVTFKSWLDVLLRFMGGLSVIVLSYRYFCRVLSKKSDAPTDGF